MNVGIHTDEKTTEMMKKKEEEKRVRELNDSVGKILILTQTVQRHNQLRRNITSMKVKNRFGKT